MARSPAPRPTSLSIGGATYDLFVRTGDELVCADCPDRVIQLPVGHKVRVKEVIEACGGGAANTAVGLRRLGVDASFAGIMGDDQWGERMLENLKKEGVDASGATIIEGETSSFSLILNIPSGERVILYATGVNAHLHDVTFDRDALTRAGWIYFNHIHEKSCVIEDDIAAILRASHDTGMTWNPGGRQLTKGMEDEGNRNLLAQTDLLLLNKEEAVAFSGKQRTEAAIKAFLKAGVKIVCVTDGKNGALASDGRALYRCPVIEDAPVIDTTGAGDAFGTGATWALMQGLDLPTMLKAGTINATSVLATIGSQAGLLTDTEIQKQLQQTTLTVDVRPL